MPRLTQWLKAKIGRNNKSQIDAVRGPAAIERWMQEKIGTVLDIPAESLNPTEPLTSYGLDSIAGFTLTLDLAEWLGRELPASLLWEYPTISELAKFLGEDEKSAS